MNTNISKQTGPYKVIKMNKNKVLSRMLCAEYSFNKTPNVLAPCFPDFMAMRSLSVQKILWCLIGRGFSQKLILTLPADLQTPFVVATYEHKYR